MPKLYDHQKKALQQMHNGCILNGGVGSGKSMTSLAYYYICQGGNIDKIDGRLKGMKDLYIITTARKRDDAEWEIELARWLMSTNDDINPYGNKVVVDSWNNIGKYSKVSGAFFIFDEQRVVGRGEWVKAFLKIARVNDWILLSATPGDKWEDYIPVFIANGFYRNRTEFNEEHCVFSRYTKFPKIEKYINTGRLIRLRNRVLVDMEMDRSTVEHNEDIWCDYDISEYKAISKERWNPWKNEPITNASEYCQCLRRLINTDVSRQTALLELVEKHPRCIIFYNFNYELEILRDIFHNSDYIRECAEWNGQMHQPVPEGDRWVYLVQYTAGAEGWNCIKTDTIIFYSQTYSYRMLEQAKGRINRLNTPYVDLYYYHLRSRAGLDLAITRALKSKKKFNEKKFFEL